MAAVEASLGPAELVLQFLAKARTFPSLEDYTRSIVGQPVSAAPMSRIATGAQSSARAAMKGAPREDVDAAVRRATGDGVFLFVLVVGLNGAAKEIARTEGLRTAATFYWMGCLLGGPHEKDLEPKAWAEHRKELTGKLAGVAIRRSRACLDDDDRGGRARTARGTLPSAGSPRSWPMQRRRGRPSPIWSTGCGRLPRTSCR